jgi:hypothetical protein
MAWLEAGFVGDDRKLLLLAPRQDPGDHQPPRRVAGGPAESIFQPGWGPEGRLHFISDRTDWWNLYREEDDGSQTNLTPRQAEFGVPMWEFRYSTYAFLSDGRIMCLWRDAGVHHLGMLDPMTSELLELDLPYSCFDPPCVVADGMRVALIASSLSHTVIDSDRPLPRSMSRYALSNPGICSTSGSTTSL